MTWPTEHAYGTSEWLVDIVNSLRVGEHMGDTNNVLDALIKQHGLPFVWDDNYGSFGPIDEEAV